MANPNIVIKCNEWFHILKDIGETHPQNLHLFYGFEVGKVGSEKIIYGKGSRDSSTDKH